MSPRQADARVTGDTPSPRGRPGRTIDLRRSSCTIEAISMGAGCSSPPPRRPHRRLAGTRACHRDHPSACGVLPRLESPEGVERGIGSRKQYLVDRVLVRESDGEPAALSHAGARVVATRGSGAAVDGLSEVRRITGAVAKTAEEVSPSLGETAAASRHLIRSVRLNGWRFVDRRVERTRIARHAHAAIAIAVDAPCSPYEARWGVARSPRAEWPDEEWLAADVDGQRISHLASAAAGGMRWAAPTASSTAAGDSRTPHWQEAATQRSPVERPSSAPQPSRGAGLAATQHQRQRAGDGEWLPGASAGPRASRSSPSFASLVAGFQANRGRAHQRRRGRASLTWHEEPHFDRACCRRRGDTPLGQWRARSTSFGSLASAGARERRPHSRRRGVGREHSLAPDGRRASVIDPTTTCGSRLDS